MSPKNNNSSNKNDTTNWLEDIVNYRMETGRMKALTDEEISTNNLQSNNEQYNFKRQQSYQKQNYQNQNYQKQNYQQQNYQNKNFQRYQNLSHKQQSNYRSVNTKQNNRNFNPSEFEDTYRMRGITRQNNRRSDYNNNNYVVQNRQQQKNSRNNNERNDKFLEQTTYGTLCYDKNVNLNTMYGKNHNDNLYLKDKNVAKNDILKKVFGFLAVVTVLVLFVFVLDKVGVISI